MEKSGLRDHFGILLVRTAFNKQYRIATKWRHKFSKKKERIFLCQRQQENAPRITSA